MERRPDSDPPLLAQVPPEEIPVNHREATPQQRRVTRRQWPARVRRLAAVLFFGLGIVSVAALVGASSAALSDGLDGSDLAVLAMLTLLTFAIAAQAVAMMTMLPGGRAIRRRITANRMRRSTRSTGPRPLLSEVDAGRLIGEMTPTGGTRTASRARQAAGTAGWVTLTLTVIAPGCSATILLATKTVRSFSASGVAVGPLFLAGLTLLVGFGIGTMSVGLMRSWFERRLRRPGRLLRRLLRFLLRIGDRGAAQIGRLLRRYHRRFDIPPRLAAGAGGTALVVVAALSVPVSAVGGATAQASGPGSSSTSTTNQVLSVDHEETPGITTDGDGTQEVVPLNPGSATTSVTIADSTTSSTVAESTTTTTTTAPKPTTTTTAPKPTTTTTTTTEPKPTTTTTTEPPDTTGPSVSGVSASPGTIFTSGSPPDTSHITASASDASGVASMSLYYRQGGGKFVVWTTVTGDSLSVTFGPFGTAGSYEYRIMATDTLGNTNCKSAGSCPGGSVAVIIP